MTGALWCTLFDAAEPEPRAVKQSLPDPRAGDWLELGPSHIGPDGARGRAEAQGRSAAWELTFGPASEPLRHLPHPKLYDAPLPRTKTESPLPDTTISGWVEADGERWELDAWPGMLGHNWGAEHAERWIWLHGVGFDGAPDAWLDVALGRIRIGRFTTPWIANGAAASRRGADPPRRPGPACARGRAAGRWDDRGQRRAHRGARGAAGLLGLLRPLRRRAPQYQLLDRFRRAEPCGAHAADGPWRGLGARYARGARGCGASAVPGSVTYVNGALREGCELPRRLARPGVVT